MVLVIAAAVAVVTTLYLTARSAENDLANKVDEFGPNLIITPEFIRRMRADHPDVVIYAIRLDRGMSSDETLRTGLGENPEAERGLNEIQYIVPGAGGVGEILNNSFV